MSGLQELWHEIGWLVFVCLVLFGSAVVIMTVFFRSWFEPNRRRPKTVTPLTRSKE